MGKKHKYQIGDVVIHAASSPINGVRMIITAIGSLKNEDGEILLYQVSGERQPLSQEDHVFFRSILEESEIKIYLTRITVDDSQ